MKVWYLLKSKAYHLSTLTLGESCTRTWQLSKVCATGVTGGKNYQKRLNGVVVSHEHYGLFRANLRKVEEKMWANGYSGWRR